MTLLWQRFFIFMRKQKIYISMVFIFILLGLFIFVFFKSPPSKINTEIPIKQTISSNPETATTTEIKPISETNSSQNPVKKEIRITLKTKDTIYTASVPTNSSVYDAMNIISSTTSFRFKAKYYSGLGYFIQEVNEITNLNGTYWTLYINGLYSTKGASQYVLKNGDIIEWKFEKK